MRLVTGLLLFHLLVLGIGTTFLYAVKLPGFQTRKLLATLGIAHLAGVALYSLLALFALILGIRLKSSNVLLLALVPLVALLAIGKIRRRKDAESQVNAQVERNPQLLLNTVVTTLIAVFTVWGITLSKNISTAWDAAHNWTFKATVLYDHGFLLPSVFDNSQLFATSHLDYPLLQPTFASLLFNFAGKASQTVIVAELWLLLLAFVYSARFLIGNRMPTLAIAPLGLAVIAQTTGESILRGDADITIAIFFSIGMLALGLWLEQRKTGLLLLAVLMLGAAINIKNEGLAFSLAITPVLLISARTVSRKTLIQGGLAVIAVAALILPWRLRVSAHGPFPIDYTPLSEALNWGFLTERLTSLDMGARGVLAALEAQSYLYWLAPAFCVFCLIGLLPQRQATRRLVCFYFFSVAAMIFAILWVYWTSPQPDLAGHVSRTASRLVATPLFTAAVGLTHLLTLKLHRPSGKTTTTV